MKHTLLIIASLIFTTSAFGQVGNCEPALAEAYLNVNNVRARILNNGGLFWRGSPQQYEVPKYGGAHAIFSAGIWIGGKFNEEIRTAASTYGPWEFWPGPLDDAGNPPADCKPYDRIYSIYQRDISAYEDTGEISQDLAEWPWQLGAPVIDGDGNPDNYNLAGGDRPEIHGHQTLWWVMNDRGNAHEDTETSPIGLEVQVTAFAAASHETYINDATLYTYKLIYKGTSPLEETYVGFWQDVDLGSFDDDYIGSDSTLGIGYTYNADNFDDSSIGYGDAPPAIGFKFLQGPLVNNDGIDNDLDGLVDESDEHLTLSSFSTYYGGGGVLGDPSTGPDFYNILKARWRDGTRITYGGNGYDFSNTPTSYFFSGDPVTGTGWTPFNPVLDGSQPALMPYDQRSSINTGPFTLMPGDVQEITIGVLWARGEDHLDSITKLREAAVAVQEAFDAGFNITPPPVARLSPISLTAPADQATNQPVDAILQWKADSTAEAYQVQWSTDSSFTDSSLTDSSFTDNFFSYSHTQQKVTSTFFQVPNLAPDAQNYWRVRSITPVTFGPWSETRQLSTSLTRVGSGRANFAGFMTVANAAGPIDPPDMAVFAFDQSGFPSLEGNLTPQHTYPDPLQPTPGVQQSTSNATWGIHAWTSTTRLFDNGEFNSFVGTSTSGHRLDTAIGTDAYEWRFTERCFESLNAPASTKTCFAESSSNNDYIKVPFELWNIGDITDSADDYRMIPQLCNTCLDHFNTNNFELNGNHPAFEGMIAPYTTPVDWYNPEDNGTSPGETGYESYFPLNRANGNKGSQVFNGMVLIQLDAGAGPPYEVALPEPGTIFRIIMAPTQAPLPSSPANRSFASSHSVPLYWSATPAAGYQLHLDNSPAFSAPVIDIKLDAPAFLTPDLAEDKTYYWRVRLLDDTGEATGEWSDTWQFTIPDGVGTNQGIPDAFILQQSYPNPVSTTAFIRYALPSSEQIKLEIFDTLGRHVQVLVDGQQTAGWHETALDATNLSNGLYFYRLTAGAFTDTKTITLIR